MTTSLRVEMRIAHHRVHVRLALHAVKRLTLDCKPFGPRPDTFLPAALARTGLECKAPRRTVFGEWTFDFSEDVSSKEWNALLPAMIANLHLLHDHGSIRYAEWTPPIR
jgi:hypothetical protein